MPDTHQRIAHLTPEQRRLLELRLKKKNLAAPPPAGIPRRGGAGPHPLSANQAWLWELSRKAGGQHPGWNVYTGMRFFGPVDPGPLARAINEVCRRHEVLRSCFPVLGGRPVQRLLPEDFVHPVPVVDVAALPVERQEPEVQRFFGERWRQVFDLEHGPVCRFTLARSGPEHWQLLVMMHHMATDWVSYALFERELAQIYQAFRTGRPSPLPPLGLQVSDFSHWEQEWLQGETARGHLAWWKEALAGLPVLSLPTDFPRPPVQSHRGARPHFHVGEATYRRLRALGKEEEASLFYVTTAALNALFHLLSGQEDFAIGSPVVGRNQRDLEDLIGLFLNYLPLRAGVSGDPTFRELVRRARKTALEAYAHQDLPLGAILPEVVPEFGPERHPLFQVAWFWLENPPMTGYHDVGVRLLVTYGGTSRFDLLVSIWDQGSFLEGWFEYDRALWRRETVEGWLARFVRLLDAVAEQPDVRLSQHVC